MHAYSRQLIGNDDDDDDDDDDDTTKLFLLAFNTMLLVS